VKMFQIPPVTKTFSNSILLYLLSIWYMNMHFKNIFQGPAPGGGGFNEGTSFFLFCIHVNLKLMYFVIKSYDDNKMSSF